MKRITTRHIQHLTRRWALVGLSLAMLLTGACAEHAAGALGGGDSAGYCRDTRIVNGKTEPNFHAAGALVEGGEAFCTGTLVDTTTVVTAAHCIHGSADAKGLKMYFGPDARDLSTGTVVDVVSIHAHPEYNDMTVENDIAVLKLAKPVAINPIRMLTQPMTKSWVGRQLVFVGYGVTRHDKTDGGIKRSVQIPMSEVMPTAFRYDSPSKNTCFGDSGGGAFVKIDGQHYLVGVTSYGDDYCKEYGVNTRVDSYGRFLSQHLASEPCAGIDGDASADNWGGPPAASGAPSGAPGVDAPDTGEDFCETQGWYTDEACDVGCPKPDPACEGMEDLEEGDAGSEGDAPAPESDGDFCEEEGWYGDTICDEDCPKPDPDCA